MKRAVPLLAMMALIAACGGGTRSLTPEEEAVVVALDGQIATESAGTGEPFTNADERRCVAEGVVREVGLARLAEMGVTADGSVDSRGLFDAMTEAELVATADLAVECSDLENVFIEIGGMEPSSAKCFAERLTEEGTYSDLVLAGLKDEEPADSIFVAMLAAGTDCLSDEEFAAFFGTGG